MSNNKSRVFLSYSKIDFQIANKISVILREENIDVVFDYNDTDTGENIFEQIRYMYESSETVIILLSQSLFSSSYFTYEFPKHFFEEARKRKITIIPVLIEKCQIPSDFLEYQIVNLTNDFDKGIHNIIRKLKIIPEISFDYFSPSDFEQFTLDLLREFAFKNIQQQPRINDLAIDFIADSYSRDIFGLLNKQTWIIETKFYRQERFSINSLHQIIESFSYINRFDAKILLITNSVLTSIAEEYIEDIQRSRNIEIKVLDGTRLKKIVANRKRLLNKYFLR